MSDAFQGMSPQDLIFRALEEDHAAIKATSREARVAHAQLAKLMRARADEILAAEAKLDGRPRWST